jgi:hypothetical protein
LCPRPSSPRSRSLGRHRCTHRAWSPEQAQSSQQSKDGIPSWRAYRSYRRWETADRLVGDARTSPESRAEATLPASRLPDFLVVCPRSLGKRSGKRAEHLDSHLWSACRGGDPPSPVTQTGGSRAQTVPEASLARSRKPHPRPIELRDPRHGERTFNVLSKVGFC